MTEATTEWERWQPLRAALSDIIDQLARADVPRSALPVLDPEAELDLPTVSRFIDQQGGAPWLKDLPAAASASVDVAEHLAPTVYQLTWSVSPADGEASGLHPWLRGALAAHLTHRRFPQLCVPPPQSASWRSLDHFAYQQAGALVARLYGDRALVRLLTGVVTSLEVFGPTVAQAVAEAIEVEGLTPGRGSDEPARFGNALIDAFLASGQELPLARATEQRMAWEAIAFTCVRPTDSGIANVLPFASCYFDFQRRSVSSHGFQDGTEKSSVLPPGMCQRVVDAGRTEYAASLAATSPRAVDVLIRTVFRAG